MDERLADSVGVQHVAAAVMRGLALVAFLLAVIGLYGVLAYLVAKRTHEFGVRLALGARQRDVIAMLLAEAMGVVGVGVVVGLVASFVAAHVIKGSLYGVGALEPWCSARWRPSSSESVRSRRSFRRGEAREWTR
jgi:ABC-type antimicrobial peptide transport system permease subunit